MSRAKLFVDSVPTALQKSGDVLLAIAEGSIAEDDVQTELGDVIAGLTPGRESDNDITLFNSVGIALQDLAIGKLIVERARQAGIGVEINLSD